MYDYHRRPYGIWGEDYFRIVHLFTLYTSRTTPEVAQLKGPLTGCVAAGPVAGGGEGGGGREPAAGQPHQVTLRPLLLHR